MHENNLQPIPEPDPELYPALFHTADLSETILREKKPVVEPTPVIVALARVADPEKVIEYRRPERARETSLKRRGSGDPLMALRRVNNRRR